MYKRQAVSQKQSVIDTIGKEVAETGALSAGTALALAGTTNLSMQEIANIAENAMGLDASKATGPSTSLVPASSVALDAFGGPGTDVATTSTSNTGIATLDPSRTEVGGLVGEIITDTNVGAATAQTDPEFDTIEGTTNSTEVDSAANTDTEVFVNDGVIVDPEISTEVNVPVNENVTIDGTVNPNAVVPVNPNAIATTVEVDSKKPVVPLKDVKIVPVNIPIDDEDDKGITVEVDEDVGDDDGGATIDLDPIDIDSDDDDGDELVPLEDDFECPDGYQKVMIKGQFVCQQIDSLPEKVRPTGGAYYQTNKNPEYGSRRRA